MALTGSAHAYLRGNEYTEEEKIGFAFYKLGNIKPNFDSWVEHTDAYSNAPANQKNQFLQNETSRLEQGYHNYQPDEDLIVINAPVKITTADFSSPDPAYSKQGIQKQSVISIVGTPPAYLPFKIVNTWVAVIPQDYSNFTNLLLTTEQFIKLRDIVSEKVKLKDLDFQGEIELILRPAKVDARKPINMDGKKMWLMGAEIASMTIWTQKKEKIIWEYSAPWYVTGHSMQLLNLYGD